jgi:hypothetical protein
VTEITEEVWNKEDLHSYLDDMYCGTYVVEDESKRVKIGNSKNIRRRIKNLQIGNAEQLILRVVSVDDEKKLHKAFEHCRIRGEWFSLHDATLRAAIETVEKRFAARTSLAIYQYKLIHGSKPFIAAHGIITF